MVTLLLIDLLNYLFNLHILLSGLFNLFFWN